MKELEGAGMTNPSIKYIVLQPKYSTSFWIYLFESDDSCIKTEVEKINRRSKGRARDVMNSIISCVGGKKALRELMYQRMPKNFARYIYVLGGGGSIEVYKDFNADMTSNFISYWHRIAFFRFLQVCL